MWKAAFKPIIVILLLLCAYCNILHAQSSFQKHLNEKSQRYGLADNSFSSKGNFWGDSVITAVGRWPYGSCESVGANSQYVFYVDGMIIEVLRIGDSDSLTKYCTLSDYGYVKDLCVNDTLLYLCNPFSLRIVSIANPFQPKEIGVMNTPPGGLSIFIEFPYVYIGTITGLVSIIDVSNPAAPFIRKSLAIGFDNYLLTVKNRILYINSLSSFSLFLLNAQNLDSIYKRVLDSSNPGSYCAEIQDSILYVGSYGFVSLYNISVVDTPKFMSLISCGLIKDIIVQDSLFYATSDYGMFTINAADPFHLRQQGFLPKYPGFVGKGVLFGNTICEAYGNGLWVINKSNPDTLNEISFYPTGYYAHGMAMRDSLLFVASGIAGLWILNIADESNPRSVSNIQTGGDASDVIVDSDLAYVFNLTYSSCGDTSRGLVIIDISNPNEPKIISHHIGIARCNVTEQAITKYGDYIFMISAQDFNPVDSILEIIDVSNPYSPITVKTFSSNLHPFQIAVKDSLAYLATFPGGIRVLNWQSPGGITEIGNFLPADATSIELKDTFAIVGEAYLRMISVANPLQPVEVGSTLTHTGAGYTHIAVDGDYVYWTDDDFGVVDIANPSIPKNVGIYSEFSEAVDVLASKGMVYITTYPYGVWIMKNNLITEVENRHTSRPSGMKLFQNYPNPFNPSTVISYDLSEGRYVSLKVFNMLGLEVSVLVNGYQYAGRHSATFNVANLSNGIYFYKLSVGRFTEIKKMVLMK